MSYDFDTLVEAIRQARLREHQDAAAAASTSDHDDTKPTAFARASTEAIELFQELSFHCPMTPLLWILYANSVRSETDRLEIVNRGLREFPGSDLLHLYHYKFTVQDKDVNAKIQALESSLQNIGQGSHPSRWITPLYRTLVDMVSESHSLDTEAKAMVVINVWVRRAFRPLDNESLSQEVNKFCSDHSFIVAPADEERLERARRWAAKTFASWNNTWEADIDLKFQQEGIIVPCELDWDDLLQASPAPLPSFGMGAGGIGLAQTFIAWARAVHRQASATTTLELVEIDSAGDSGDDQDAPLRPSLLDLSLQIYERGVAECPTVECLWDSYIRHVSLLVSRQDEKPSDAFFRIAATARGRLESICQRAVRNCPYSIRLVQHQLESHLLLAQTKHIVFDPDKLLDMIQNALDRKFLAGEQAFWGLYQAALQIITRRTLQIISIGVAYDGDEEVIVKKGKSPSQVINDSTSFSDEKEQELDDILDDLQEMYTEIEIRMKKTFVKWSQGRALLAANRAQVEALLITPLRRLGDDQLDEQASSRSKSPSELAWEDSVRVHQPSHPDLHLGYIRCFLLSSPVYSSVGVGRRLRQARFLFQKAVQAVGKPKQPLPFPASQDFEVALKSLCHEWMEFERLMGSPQSRERAAQIIKKKLRKSSIGSLDNKNVEAFEPSDVSTASSAVTVKTGNSQVKRSFEAVPDDARPTKKKRIEDSEQATSSAPTLEAEATVATSPTVSEEKKLEISKVQLRDPPLEVHKVRIGDLEYPAHPYTVRVSFISPKTEDMDLVDLLRPRCGAIVHARIIRDKGAPNQTGKQKSKGWALVQFEDSDSVEKALALNDVIGLHEKVLKIERSHQAAAPLVPPGMHRVSDKGGGKHSKRNQKRREGANDTSGKGGPPERVQESAKSDKQPIANSNDTHQASSLDVLAFRPRGVTRHTHQKQRLSLSSKKQEK